MSTKTICDKCGKEIRPSEPVYEASAFKKSDGDTYPTNKFPDLCGGCVTVMFSVCPQEAKRG